MCFPLKIAKCDSPEQKMINDINWSVIPFLIKRSGWKGRKDPGFQIAIKNEVLKMDEQEKPAKFI